MTNVRDVIATGAQRSEKFNGGHDRDVGTHGNRYGKREEPDAAIGKEHRVGDENSENRTRGADGGNVRGRLGKKNRNRFHEDFDNSRAHAAQEEIIEKAALAPHQLEIASEHPQHEHIQENMQQAAMQEHIRKGLPDAEAMSDRRGDQPEDLSHVVVRGELTESQVQQGLKEEDAGADEDEELNAGGDEPPPVEVITARAERPHRGSVRAKGLAVKESINRASFGRNSRGRRLAGRT